MNKNMKIGIWTSIVAYVLSIVGVIYVNKGFADELK